MQVYGSILPGAARLARLRVELSSQARRRLKWLDYYARHGENGRLTCRHFDISPDTLYRWLRRFDPGRLSSLEGRSQRPGKLRQPTWSSELAQAVRELRERYPRWGKDKLAPLLREAGWAVSTSMVGRILRQLQQRGVLLEAHQTAVRVRRSRPLRPYATRKPREYEAREPGDIVQVDTLDLRPLPNVSLKHFTARDVVSRWDVIEVHRQATSHTAASFLSSIQARMPFPVRAIQVDGGSEFMAEFERACEIRGIRLFVLPPRSPKLNGRVERAQRTHREEFYEVWDLEWSVGRLQPDLLAWEEVYNRVRPHQAIGYRTPAQFVTQWRAASGERR